MVLPETCAAHVDALAKLIAVEDSQAIPPHPIRRLAALLPPSPDVAEAIAARLRLSKAQRARLVSAAERMADDTLDPFALAYRISVEFAVDRLLLFGKDARSIADWQPPQFPLKGGAIVARGVAAGPEVARIMQWVERQWVEEGFPDAARIEELVSKALTER